MSNKNYAHPEALVTTEWVAAHKDDPSVRVVESNEDVLLYSTGHIPGAIHIDWQRDLNDAVRRDYLNATEFSALCSRNGISN
ncbi:MAG TPA: sulfurtransferase, partial [Anaerolineae bacterium]|nr:sulfurtransferase [Anaerolineae bacterium]